MLGRTLGSSMSQIPPGRRPSPWMHLPYSFLRSLMHSASDTQDRQRPSMQMPLHSSWSVWSTGMALPWMHRCPYLSVQLQMGAHRPRSQKPSPHSPSTLQSRSGTSFDQGWVPTGGMPQKYCPTQSSAIALSSAVNRPSGVGTFAVGSYVLALGAADTMADGAGCGGCTTPPPAGASLLEEQAPRQRRSGPATSATPYRRLVRAVRFLRVLMALHTPEPCRLGLPDRRGDLQVGCHSGSPSGCSKTASP